MMPGLGDFTEVTEKNIKPPLVIYARPHEFISLATMNVSLNGCYVKDIIKSQKPCHNISYVCYYLNFSV